MWGLEVPWFLTAWKASQLYSLIKDYSPGKFHFLHYVSPINKKKLTTQKCNTNYTFAMTGRANTESTSSFSAKYRLAQKSLHIRWLTHSLLCPVTFAPLYILWLLQELDGDRGSTVVKVLCYKSEGHWLDPSWCQWIFHWHKIPLIALWPWGRLSL